MKQAGGNQHGGGKDMGMSYGRFGAMILTSTVVLRVLRTNPWMYEGSVTLPSHTTSRRRLGFRLDGPRAGRRGLLRLLLPMSGYSGTLASGPRNGIAPYRPWR